RRRAFNHCTHPRPSRRRPRTRTDRSPAGMAKKTTSPTKARKTDPALVRQLLDASEGILRLAPTWVPRSFLMPGRRIKLAPQDFSPYGADGGAMDERCSAPTTPPANEGAEPDEGLSYIVKGNRRACTLRDAIEVEGEAFVGPDIWKKY